MRPNRPSRTRAASAPESALTRYRTLIFGGAIVVVVLILGFVFFFSNQPSGVYAASGPGYVCDTLLTPGPSESVTPTPVPTPSPTPSPTPTPSPSPSGSLDAGASASPSASPSPEASATPIPPPTPRLGFTTTVLGRSHVALNTTVDYGFCPPTSGNHYASGIRGPIPAAVYPSTSEQPPGGWIHNLEHGWVVALYRCTGPADCPTDAEMQQLQAFYDQAPLVQAQCSKEVLVARFDGMDKPFALVAWGRALLMDEFDLDKALTFAQQWMDYEATPERTTC